MRIMDKYYLITGYNIESVGVEYLTYSQVLGSTNLVSTQISKNNISFSIPRVDWVKGKVFNSYTEEDNENSYAVHNNNVYLCLSNNLEGVKNIINSSNYAPNHTIGTVRKSDGYLWMFLYSITSTVSALSNINFIPAPSVYGLKSLLINQEIDVMDCSESGSTGTCVQYMSQTGNTYATLLYSGITSCSICSSIAEETTKTDLLWTKFYNPGDSIPSSISLFDYTTSLENAIASGKINPKLNFEAKNYTTAVLSGLSAGCILSANINLSAIDAVDNTYLNVLSSETTITATGGNGIGASIEFLTTVIDSVTSRITGINLISGGTDYRPELITILLPGIASGTRKTTLINNIELIGTPPSLVFPYMNTIFDVASQNSIGEDRIVNIVNAKPDAYMPTANYYGLVKADTGKTAISDIVPSKLRIYPLGSTGSASGKEIRNINFVQTINTTETQRR